MEFPPGGISSRILGVSNSILGVLYINYKECPGLEGGWKVLLTHAGPFESSVFISNWLNMLYLGEDLEAEEDPDDVTVQHMSC